MTYTRKFSKSANFFVFWVWNPKGTATDHHANPHFLTARFLFHCFVKNNIQKDLLQTIHISFAHLTPLSNTSRNAKANYPRVVFQKKWRLN